MESLLRLSGILPHATRTTSSRVMTNPSLGLLNEDDNGRTDLGTLEKRLQDKSRESMSQRASAGPGSHPTSPSTKSTSNGANESTPLSHLASPEPPNKTVEKKKDEPEKPEEEVEALSDMMCSLVTNNCG